jgi:hypothetical protein
LMLRATPSPSQMYFPEKKRRLLHFAFVETNMSSCSPATNRRFTSDILYPLPESSKSMPDSVVPSQLNCVVRIDGVEGPLPISRRARSVSMPPLSECCEMSVKFQTSLFDSPNLKSSKVKRMQTFRNSKSLTMPNAAWTEHSSRLHRPVLRWKRLAEVTVRPLNDYCICNRF